MNRGAFNFTRHPNEPASLARTRLLKHLRSIHMMGLHNKSHYANQIENKQLYKKISKQPNLRLVK